MLTERTPNDYVPIHGDPVASNMLMTESDDIVFIDWEYSGNFEGLWDLALLSVNAHFCEKEDIRLLNLYNDEATKQIYDKFIVYKSLVHLWKYFWFRLSSIKIEDSVEKQNHLKCASEQYAKFIKSTNKLNLKSITTG